MTIVSTTYTLTWWTFLLLITLPHRSPLPFPSSLPSLPSPPHLSTVQVKRLISHTPSHLSFPAPLPQLPILVTIWHHVSLFPFLPHHRPLLHLLPSSPHFCVIYYSCLYLTPCFSYFGVHRLKLSFSSLSTPVFMTLVFIIGFLFFLHSSSFL